jgi:hypothetical protein
MLNAMLLGNPEGVLTICFTTAATVGMRDYDGCATRE